MSNVFHYGLVDVKFSEIIAFGHLYKQLCFATTTNMYIL